MLIENEYQQAVVKMRNKVTRLEREGEYWSDEERAQMQHFYDIGVGLTEIAILLQRTELAVIQQALAMNLFSPPYAKRKYTPRPPCCLCARCKLDPALCPRNQQVLPIQEVAQC